MMCNSKAFLKRMLPFVATFAVGLLIASFFVPITAPNFRGGRAMRHHEMKRLRVENENLKNENLRLRNELESRQWNTPHAMHFEEWNNQGVEFPVPLPPPQPAAPRAKR